MVHHHSNISSPSKTKKAFRGLESFSFQQEGRTTRTKEAISHLQAKHARTRLFKRIEKEMFYRGYVRENIVQSYSNFGIPDILRMRIQYPDGPDGREMGAKRQRMVDQGPSFYGNSPGSSFMYNTPPYGYVSQPPPPFPVVRLRGLPFDCAETDVAEFFRGLDIVDVLFVHKGGKFTGEAFCVLGYPLQVDFALQKNRQNMGRRYVEVFRSKRQDYYKAIANEVSESRGSPRRNISRAKSYDEGKDLAEHTGVLRLRGLPFSAGKDDIMEFFKDFVISEDSIHITMNSEGRPTGEAFVEFANAEDSKAAMAKDRMTLGSRYIELFPSSIEELDEAVSRGR
ncbi:heterogeneous nuclear ribonucleoprotein F-like [Populus alba x Populus x berolinensis]|nr:heterogeneous nuclear ribonucleoprotein F-like [Populus alba x Populus x berolinensis]